MALVRLHNVCLTPDFLHVLLPAGPLPSPPSPLQKWGRRLGLSLVPHTLNRQRGLEKRAGMSDKIRLASHPHQLLIARSQVQVPELLRVLLPSL